MKITITGSLYSGKSTVAKALSEILNYELLSVGEVQRKLAVEHNMSITEYNKFISEHHLDYEIDEKTKRLGQEKDNFIFDGRMSWKFVPDSYKIYFFVSKEEAIQRAMRDNRGKSESYNTIEEAEKRIEERTNLERDRFKRLYNVDIFDKENYDLIVDTSNMNIEEVIQYTIQQINSQLKS